MNGPVDAAPRARCAVHPQRAAPTTCPRCGGFRCDGCLAGRNVCRECASQILATSSVAQRARWAQYALWGTVASKGVEVVVLLAVMVFPSAEMWKASLMLAFPVAALGIATVVTFLMWNYALAKVTSAFELELDSPIATVAWWFVPFANLAKPYVNLRESLVQLRSEAAVDEARLGWWWGLLLGGHLIGLRFWSDGQVVFSAHRTLASLILTGIAASLGARMIRLMQATLQVYATPDPVVVSGPIAARPQAISA